MHPVRQHLTALAILAHLAAPLAAQRDTAAARLPDLVVQVARTPASLTTFGGAVSVLSGDAVQRGRLATGLDEALAFVPGVLVANRWNYSLDQRLVIRGFGARANFGVRGVKVLLDGVPQTLPDGQSQLTNVDLARVERVEVLRGAASALHGNAAGGVVAFTTEVAPSRRGVTLDAGVEAGTFGSSRLQARVASRGVRASGSVSASRFSTDGFRAQSAAEQRRLSGALDVVLASSTRLLVRGAWADDPRAENPGALTAAEARTTPALAAPNNVRRRADKAVQQGQLTLGLDHASSTWDVSLRTWGIARDLENPIAAPAPPPTVPEEGLWIGIARRVVGSRAAVTRRLVGGGRLTGGVDLQHARDDRVNRRHLAGTPTGPALLDQREVVTELGTFVEVDVPITGGLALRTGARRDAVRFEVTDHRASTVPGARTLDAVTGHAGLTWAGRRGTAWASVASAFETPTTTELANRPDGTTGLNRDLDPQHSRMVEVGARTTHGRAALELAAWHTSTRDAIVPFQEVGGRSFFVNAGQLRIRGIEAAARAPVHRRLDALVTWTFTDAIFQDYALTLGGTTVRYDGNRVAGIPRHLLRLGLRGALGSVSLDLDHAVTSAQFADDANTQLVPGGTAGVTGVRASTRVLAGGGMAVVPFVAVQNLWDRRYVASVTVNGGFGRVFEPSAGRVISVGMTVTRHLSGTSRAVRLP